MYNGNFNGKSPFVYTAFFVWRTILILEKLIWKPNRTQAEGFHEQAYGLVFRFISRWAKQFIQSMLIIQFHGQVAIFFEHTLHMTIFKEMYTCSNCVDISIGDKRAFCSRRAYFSADSNSTYKKFFSSTIIRNIKTKKIYLLIFQWFWNIWNNTTCIHILFSRQPCLFIYRRTITE